MTFTRRAELSLIIQIVLLALVLRVVGHAQAPNGWRDDELSNALVVSQHVLDGEVRLYYDDASGHEGMYHWMQAGTLALFGETVAGIRGVSILLGTLGVLLTYLVARRLYDPVTAAIAAIALALSFWSLMYSRSGQRHISVTVTTLLSFWLLWGALRDSDAFEYDWRKRIGQFVLAGLVMGVGFYTYFASRGVPLIVIGWLAYLLIWRPNTFRQIWPGVALSLVVAAILAAPLINILRTQPEAEARVAELAAPIYAARDGDFSLLGEYTLTTLAMFTHNGDSEVLYNVPHRPIFGILGGILFWAGVLLALIRTFGPQRDPRTAFLLLWLFAGLAPGVLSVPAASLGHTILAQPVSMIFPALAITSAGEWLVSQPGDSKQQAQAAILSAMILFLGWEAVRAINDYWRVWPADSFNRVLHHSDLHEAAPWLNENAETRDVAIGSFLTERWDQQAFRLDLEGDDWRVRVYDPRRVALFVRTGGLTIIPSYFEDEIPETLASYADTMRHTNTIRDLEPPPHDLTEQDAVVNFYNNLSVMFAGYDQDTDSALLEVQTCWRVIDHIELPPRTLLSKPPAPDEDDSPRLATTIQLLAEDGAQVAGADGLGVDPYTLYPDDTFCQLDNLSLSDVPAGNYTLILGLYDPLTSERILTSHNRDTFTIATIPLP